MKKIILLLAILITSFVTLSAQEDGWERVPEIEQYFSLFEVEVEAWIDYYGEVLNFEDTYSRDFNDMLFQLGYLMTAFNFMLEDIGEYFEDTGVDSMVYSFFIENDVTVDKYTYPNERYDIFMEYDWLIEYFDSPRYVKQEMLYDLFNYYYAEWFPSQRQF